MLRTNRKGVPCQRMLLRLRKYNLDVVYTREKELYIAYTLSHAAPEYHGQHPFKLAEEKHKSNTQSGLERSLTHILTKSET